MEIIENRQGGTLDREQAESKDRIDMTFEPGLRPRYRGDPQPGTEAWYKLQEQRRNEAILAIATGGRPKDYSTPPTHQTVFQIAKDRARSVIKALDLRRKP